MAVGFGPEATFEGRIVAELQRFEDSGMLRVLDVLFVRRAESGELETRPGIPGRSTLVSQADVDEVAGALEPGQAAGLAAARARVGARARAGDRGDRRR